MLALTDEGLARLCIGASRVPVARRSLWLWKIAALVEERGGNSDGASPLEVGATFEWDNCPGQKRLLNGTIVPLAAPPRPGSVRNPASERKRRTRERAAAGRACATVEYDEQSVIETLIASELLTESAALDKRAVAKALAAVIEEWAARWQP
jgi:hypothetical protein